MNRIERITSLSNQTFPDPTFDAIGKSTKVGMAPTFSLPKNGTVYDNLCRRNNLQTRNQETSRITALHQQLTQLWQERKAGVISKKEYNRRQAELAQELHEAEQQAKFCDQRKK